MTASTALRCAISATLLIAACSGETDTTGPDPAAGDVTPPAQVVGPTLAYSDQTGAATLLWSAPSDGGIPGTVAGYEVRYGYAFPLVWEQAVPATNPPDPLPPGKPQTWTLQEPLRGRDLYAAVRSFDGSGNASPVSDVAHVHVPGFTMDVGCIDAMTRQPIAGLEATITARRVHSLATGSDGTFSQDDLAGGSVNVAIRNGSSPTIYHHVNHPFVLGDDIDILYEMIPYQPSPSPLIDNTLQLFREAATGLGTGSVLLKWRSLPVDVHVPTFVNTRGVDYTERSLAAIERWELRTGVDLFRLVDVPPESGVDVQFLPRSVMGIQNGITVHHEDEQGFPARDEIRIIDEFGDPMQLYRVMLHELGHTIRLNHLPSGFIMYAGQPLPDDITDDEALVVQLHSALPNGFNVAPYDPKAPTP